MTGGYGGGIECKAQPGGGNENIISRFGFNLLLAVMEVGLNINLRWDTLYDCRA